MSKETGISRRKFLKATGLAASVAAIGSVIAPAITSEAYASEQAHSTMKSTKLIRGKKFFTNSLDFETLSEAAERIFPKDELGPGAKELGVPYFIDNQLASAYGINAREYTYGPYAAGAPAQGPQTALLNKDLFLQGIAALNRQSKATFKKNFPDLTDSQKDEILTMCQAGNIPTVGFTSSYFFSMLKTAVLAGVYVDPIYNGNLNMDGWKMKEYPGAQMTYADIIQSEEFQKIEPVSLADMQG
jgi:gluconate 2-dehydrogenase gamma chain